MFLLSMLQEMFNDRDGKRTKEIVEIPQNAKEIGWPSFKQEDSTFYICEKSLWVHRKANTIKRGWGNVGEQIAPRAQVLATKNTHKLSHKNSLSKPYHTKSVPPSFPLGPTDFPSQAEP